MTDMLDYESTLTDERQHGSADTAPELFDFPEDATEI